MKLSEEEFLSLIESNQGIIHKVCNMYTDGPADHEDMFQEIMLQLWKAIPRFKGDSKLSTWMYRVSLFTAISMFKKRSRISTVPLANHEVVEVHQDADRHDELKKAIARLDDMDKALVLLHLEEKSYKEMSNVLGLTENHIGVRLNRIKKKLKSMISS